MKTLFQVTSIQLSKKTFSYILCNYVLCILFKKNQAQQELVSTFNYDCHRKPKRLQELLFDQRIPISLIWILQFKTSERLLNKWTHSHWTENPLTCSSLSRFSEPNSGKSSVLLFTKSWFVVLWKFWRYNHKRLVYWRWKRTYGTKEENFSEWSVAGYKNETQHFRGHNTFEIKKFSLLLLNFLIKEDVTGDVPLLFKLPTEDFPANKNFLLLLRYLQTTRYPVQWPTHFTRQTPSSSVWLFHPKNLTSFCPSE